MSGGRFGSASGIRRTINATLPPFKSFRQITPSHRRHIPARRERRIKGERFSVRIRSEGPRGQMQDFESWMKGELLWRNRKFYRTEGDADFRERVSRSIWPSKLCLSCDKFLPARVVLSFGGKVRLLLYVFAGWGAVVFCQESSLLATFLNAAFVGEPSGLSKPENSEAPFSKTFQHGCVGV